MFTILLMFSFYIFLGTAVSLIIGVAVGVSLVILIIGMFAIKGWVCSKVYAAKYVAIKRLISRKKLERKCSSLFFKKLFKT